MTDLAVDVENGIYLRKLRQEHIGSILQLMNKEGWYYYDHKELDRYLKLEEVCFVLMHEEEVVGSIFTTNYENQAWLGNIVVSGTLASEEEPSCPTEDPSRQREWLYRNKGYAGKMIMHAMHLLGEKGVCTFRLGSVPTAIGAYKKVGFVAESFTTAQEAFLPLDVGQNVALGGYLSVEEMTPEDLPVVSRIDNEYFKSHRLRLLKELFADSISESCLCLKDRGKIVGYIMIRRRTASKNDGQFGAGPDHVYRLGPSCVLPKYGLQGFKALFERAIGPVNLEVKELGGSAKIYVVFPQNAEKKRIYADFAAMGGKNPDHVFDEHDRIFGAKPLEKNDQLWSYMQSLGFKQEYFEQTMSVTRGEHPRHDPLERAANRTQANPAGIFASATPGDKA